MNVPHHVHRGMEITRHEIRITRHEIRTPEARYYFYTFLHPESMMMVRRWTLQACIDEISGYWECCDLRE